jgi:hypothetical protein
MDAVALANSTPWIDQTSDIGQRPLTTRFPDAVQREAVHR